MPLRLRLRVQPGASLSRITGRHGDAIKVQVKAPPRDGAANEAVIELLAHVFEVRRADVRILHGLSNRNKLVEIDVPDVAAAEAVLAVHCSVDR